MRSSRSSKGSCGRRSAPTGSPTPKPRTSRRRCGCDSSRTSAGIRDPERLGGWLATTARRECLRCLRTSGRSIPVDDDSVFDRAGTEPAPELDAGLLRDERDTGLWRAFARISDRCQRLLRILTADPPPSYEDVSETLEMPIGSIGPTRQRCLDRLRSELAVEGIVDVMMACITGPRPGSSRHDPSTNSPGSSRRSRRAAMIQGMDDDRLLEEIGELLRGPTRCRPT